MSACNTGTPGGTLEIGGLGDLATAFQFAGARSLAVTQWPIVSEVAERLSSGMVKRSVSAQPKPVAEALRRTMLDILTTETNEAFSNPAFWGPMIIVGDGWHSPRRSEKPERRVSFATAWERLGKGGIYDEGLSAVAIPDSDELVIESIFADPRINRELAGTLVEHLSQSGEIIWTRFFPDRGAGGACCPRASQKSLYVWLHTER